MTQPSQIALTPIGHIRTGFEALSDCPARGRSNPADSVLDLDAGFADGLRNIEMATHAIVLYWLDRADRTALHRRARPGEAVRGVFASRSPNRPNPIALSVVRIPSDPAGSGHRPGTAERKAGSLIDRSGGL